MPHPRRSAGILRLPNPNGNENRALKLSDGPIRLHLYLWKMSENSKWTLMNEVRLIRLEKILPAFFLRIKIWPKPFFWNRSSFWLSWRHLIYLFIKAYIRICKNLFRTICLKICFQIFRICYYNQLSLRLCLNHSIFKIRAFGHVRTHWCLLVLTTEWRRCWSVRV